jgi:hypothetical protein
MGDVEIYTPAFLVSESKRPCITAASRLSVVSLNSGVLRLFHHGRSIRSEHHDVSGLCDTTISFDPCHGPHIEAS